MSNELTVFSTANYDKSLEMCTALSKSNLVPKDFQGKPENILIAMEISQRTNSSLLAVMQSLNIIQGRPTFGSKYIIAAINSTGKFSPLRFQFEEEQEEREVIYSYTVYENNSKVRKEGKVKIKNKKCRAYCTDKATGDILYSPDVSLEMAVQESWYTKDGSKWKTMPDLMLMYRSATMFGGIYAPEVTMGMSSKEEIEDITIDVTPQKKEVKQIEKPSVKEKILQKMEPVMEAMEILPPEASPIQLFVEKLSACATMEDLTALAEEQFSFDESERKEANKMYSKRKKEILNG
jgi:hypothetical protein